jgi:hypothetical protein
MAKKLARMHPRHRHQGRPQAPGHREHALRPDAHEHGRLAILGGGLEGEAELRPVDQKIEGEKEHEGERAPIGGAPRC